VGEPTIYLEDFAPGQSHGLGSRSLGRDEIVAFAREYDPQPFHLDEEAARKSPYGGLIASGWQTSAVFMRLLVDGLLCRTASMGSPGVQDLRWLRPVRPGDVLSATIRVEEVTPSRSRPDRGAIRFTGGLTNQNGEEVLAMTAVLIVGRRAPSR
jgi:acyl dehydratase